MNIDIGHIYSIAYSFLANNPLILLGVVVVLALLLWKKPAVIVKLLIAIVLLTAALYMGSLLGDIGSSGLKNKHSMTDETESKMSN